MKKMGMRVFLAAMIIAVFTSVAFAADGGLEIVEQYPEDGQTGTSMENLGVKLTFNNAVNDSANKTANDACFTLEDSEGNKLPINVYYNPKEPEQVLVLFDTEEAGTDISIQGNSEYTIKIDGDFKDNDGNTLGDDVSITFKTINQSLNTRVYLIMMFVMMGGMMVFSSMQARKKQEEDAIENNEKEAPFNPYKEAKRTGKSVEEVIAQHEKDVAKREAKAAKQQARAQKYEVDDDEEIEEEPQNHNYKVKNARSAAAAGSSYVTKLKEAAEARREEEERQARRRAATNRKK